MINAQDIKNGTCIRMDGKLYFCIEFLHVKPGKGNTFMRTKLKDVVSGYVLERRFNIGEKLEDVRVERRPYQYLYKEGEDYIFMNQETFDQHPIAHDLINGVEFLRRSCESISIHRLINTASLHSAGISGWNAGSSILSPPFIPPKKHKDYRDWNYDICISKREKNSMTSLSPTIRQIQPFYRNLYQTSGKKPENIESGEAALLSSKAVPTTFKNQRLPGFKPTPL